MDCDTDDEELDAETKAKMKLLETWKSLAPPVKEEDIRGKWYAVAYTGKRRSVLLIGKILKRFLVEKDGDVDALEMKFLKPKVGLGNLLEDTPLHLPDISTILLQDIIAGPLSVTPQKSPYFLVTEYENLKETFNIVSKLNRNNITQFEL